MGCVGVWMSDGLLLVMWASVGFRPEVMAPTVCTDGAGRLGNESFRYLWSDTLSTFSCLHGELEWWDSRQSPQRPGSERAMCVWTPGTPALPALSPPLSEAWPLFTWEAKPLEQLSDPASSTALFEDRPWVIYHTFLITKCHPGNNEPFCGIWADLESDWQTAKGEFATRISLEVLASFFFEVLASLK